MIGDEYSLQVGFEIETKIQKVKVKVKKPLGKGGQGEVYLVDYGGEDKALKWFTNLGSNPQAFADNIEKNVMRGAPCDDFLWPQDVTVWQNDTFGYIMDLRPQGYFEVTEFMLTHVRFKNYKTVIDACLKIVNAFRLLHNKGYSYQDLNDGNFFINPQNGKVLICDNDNVAPDGTVTGIAGKPRYMAPEIVMGKQMPDSLTDRFSMTVILYLLFCLNHPLEGKRYIDSSVAFTPERQQKLYGSCALFMMDPDDHDNGPDPKVHANSLAVWPCLPDYVRDLFVKAFSHKALLEKPSFRPSEVDWVKALTRFRSSIVSCSCGNDVFVKDGKSCNCERCGKMINIPYRLSLGSYSIPAVDGARIYRCQIGVCDASDALMPIGQIISKNDGTLGIRNKSEKRWDAINTKGEPRKVASDEVVPLKAGIQLMVYDGKIEIQSNQ